MSDVICELCGKPGADMDFNYAAPAGFQFEGGARVFTAHIHTDCWALQDSDAQVVLGVHLYRQHQAEEANNAQGA